jgi:hypothetical protein
VSISPRTLALFAGADPARSDTAEARRWGQLVAIARKYS